VCHERLSGVSEMRVERTAETTGENRSPIPSRDHLRGGDSEMSDRSLCRSRDEEPNPGSAVLRELTYAARGNSIVASKVMMSNTSQSDSGSTNVGISHSSAHRASVSSRVAPLPSHVGSGKGFLRLD
jgi:hypothetical protein